MFNIDTCCFGLNKGLHRNRDYDFCFGGYTRKKVSYKTFRPSQHRSASKSFDFPAAQVQQVFKYLVDINESFRCIMVPSLIDYKGCFRRLKLSDSMRI